MKTVQMLKDYDFAKHPRVTVRFFSGVTYGRVLETAAQKIVQAGAGRIVPLDDGVDWIDARDAFRIKTGR